MSIDHYTYRVTWSAEDAEHVGLCAEFASLSWLAPTPEDALSGIRAVVANVVKDLRASGVSGGVNPPLFGGEDAVSNWRRVRVQVGRGQVQMAP